MNVSVIELPEIALPELKIDSSLMGIDNERGFNGEINQSSGSTEPFADLSLKALDCGLTCGVSCGYTGSK